MLRPTSLTVLLLLLAFATQAFMLFMDTRVTYPGSGGPPEIHITYGAGSPIDITIIGDEVDLDLNWPVLFLCLLLTYALAAILSALMLRATLLRRPGAIYWGTAASIVVITLFGSVIWSKNYWGYYLTRPPVLRDVADVAEVRAVYPVVMELSDSGERSISVKPNLTSAGEVASADRSDYYFLFDRVLAALYDRDLLPAEFETDSSGLPALYPLLEQSSLLAESAPGYDGTSNFRGAVVDGRAADGNRLLIVAFMGWQVSNDHYPYYELAFRAPDESAALSFKNGQRFYYDAAGIEGMEWYIVWPVASLFLVAVGLGLVTIVSAFWRAVW